MKLLCFSRFGNQVGSEMICNRIAVAGATGNLGTRIVRSLVEQGAEVIAIARRSTKVDKVDALRESGAAAASVDLSNVAAIAKGFDSVACVVSVVQGLHDVIVEAQSILLDVAIVAGVPRFIPSDFRSTSEC